MKKLLTVTAVIELVAGLAIVISPSTAVTILFGSSPDTNVLSMTARLAGVALITLGVACLLVRPDAQSRAARGLVVAMVVYNFGAVDILAIAGIGSQQIGVALWPAVVLHVAMAVWCILAVRGKAGK